MGHSRYIDFGVGPATIKDYLYYYYYHYSITILLNQTFLTNLDLTLINNFTKLAIYIFRAQKVLLHTKIVVF